MTPRRIIVIGASAGGLSALQALFAELDPTMPAAVFAVLHTASDSRSLTSILGRNSKLPVQAAANGPFEAGVIYVAPPDIHLTLERNGMRLIQGPKENRHRPSIDVLFRSAGFVYRHAVIGVVLTGMLDDGTAGLFYVKRYGGMTIVQDPNDAEFKSMPLNATAHVKVDYIIPLRQISEVLNRLARMAMAPMEINLPGAGSSVADAIREEDEKAGIPTLYPCPECQGPLMEIRNGMLSRYRCRAGHAYGLNSLSYSQAESTERLLWSALQSLQAKAELEKTLAEIAGTQDDPLSLAYRKRYDESQRSIKLLKEALALSGKEGSIA